MKLIYSLRLKTKLMVLFALIGIGLTLVGIIGYINISSMKKNLDELYFGSFVPVNELNDLLHTYNSHIETTVFKLTNGTLSPYEASATLSAGLDKVQLIWKSYASHYQNAQEQEYIDYASAALKRANHHISRVIDVCHQGINVKRLSADSTSHVISDVNKVIDRLLKYEKDVAYHERRQLLLTYDSTLSQLIIILGLITGAVLWISYAIFSSIHREQQVLEVATENLKSANSKLESASYTDSLTGLHNRRYFNMIFERELKRAKRSASYFTFMMLDVDHFKKYNDTYGHLEGDNALKTVATTLQETLHRPGDFIFRLGGEEFAILLTDNTPEDAKKMADKICRAVEDMEIAHEGNDASNYLTVSIGVTTLVPSVDLDENIILSMADANLYEAKEQGRNCYIVTAETLKHTPRRLRAGAA